MKHNFIISYADLAEGMVIYEPWLPEDAPDQPGLPYPVWQGQDLDAKTVLVHRPSRLEDEILLANYFQDLISRAGQVIIDPSPELRPLLRRSFPQTVENSRDQKIDYLLTPSSLPTYLKRQTEIFIAGPGYLKVDPEKLAFWQNYLTSLGSGSKIGVCISRQNFVGSQDLGHWMSFFKTRGPWQFININPELEKKDLDALMRNISTTLHNPGFDHLQNLDERAALIKACDAVISESEINLALAAAAGTRAWPARTHGWQDCEEVAPMWHPVWHPDAGANTSPPKCLARYNTPWNLPQRTNILEWLALENDPQIKTDLPLHKDRSDFNLAMFYAQNNYWQSAQKAMARAYSQNKDLTDGFAQLGWIKYEATDYRGALPLLMRDYKKGRMTPEWQIKLSLALAKLRDFQSATALVEDAYQRDPALRNAYAGIAWYKVVEPIQDFPGAYDLMLRDERAQRISPAWQLNFAPVIGALGDWSAAENMVGKLLRENPTVMDGYTSLGWAGYLLGKGTEYFKEMIDTDKNLGRISLAGPYIAVYLMLKGETEQAIAKIYQIYDDYPTLKGRLSLFGWLALQTGRTGLCIELMGKEYQDNRTFSVWHPSYAVALNTDGHLDKAQEVLDRYMHYRTNTDLVHIGFGLAPEAVYTCKEFTEFIQNGYGYRQLHAYTPIPGAAL